jgi:hypothetical protein
LLGLSPSTYYYQPVLSDESELEAAIDEIAGQYPRYGTRRVTHVNIRPRVVHQFSAKMVLPYIS